MIRPEAEDIETALRFCACKHNISEAELQAKAAHDTELAADLHLYELAALMIRLLGRDEVQALLRIYKAKALQWEG